MVQSSQIDSTISGRVRIMNNCPSLAWHNSRINVAMVIISSSDCPTTETLIFCMMKCKLFWKKVCLFKLYWGSMAFRELHAGERLPSKAKTPHACTKRLLLFNISWKKFTNLLCIWTSTGRSLQMKWSKLPWLLIWISVSIKWLLLLLLVWN